LGAPESEKPRVRVGALILHDGKVVLVRHRRGASRYHLLPGGGVDGRETLAGALTREVREETGLQVSVIRPVLLSDLIDAAAPRHVVNVTFTAEVVGGQITLEPADRRVEAVDLVAPGDLGSLDLRPPMADALQDILRDWDAAPARYLGPLYRPEST